MIVGYARISTAEQNDDRQRDELAAAGCERIYVDHGVSGMRESRPKLDAMLDHLRSGDTVIVTELSRISRSMRAVINLVTTLGERGVGVRSLTQGIDTPPGQAGGAGKAMLAMFAANE